MNWGLCGGNLMKILVMLMIMDRIACELRFLLSFILWVRASKIGLLVQYQVSLNVGQLAKVLYSKVKNPSPYFK